MKVKIIAPTGYGDRYGVFHEFSSIAELPEAVANKLIHHRIAAPIVERIATPARRAGKVKE